jgi:hypothetical protein
MGMHTRYLGRKMVSMDHRVSLTWPKRNTDCMTQYGRRPDDTCTYLLSKAGHSESSGRDDTLATQTFCDNRGLVPGCQYPLFGVLVGQPPGTGSQELSR